MTAGIEFTEADLRRAAGPKSFERGLGYVHEVEDLEISDTQASAFVHGTSKYRVLLTFGDEDGLGGDCTCPHNLEGFFCKHCVAVGLAVLALGDDVEQYVEAARETRKALDSWLGSLSKEDLLAELTELLDDDPDLRRRFELRAASASADAIAVRSAVRELIVLSRDYVDYGEAYGYARDVCQAAQAIGDLIGAEAADDAIGLAREALALLAQAYESVDDSSGSVGDAAHELLDVHLRACQAAPPDPISLADYLVELLLHNDYFEPDLDDYAELLGEQGDARVRERVAAAYARDPKDWRAKSLMESMAKADGDVDAVVALYAADLDDQGRSHLRIARELDEAGRAGEALDWAERGVREATRPDHQLVEYVAGRYAAAGRVDDVLSLRRARFAAERTLGNYQALRSAATKSGVWPAERAEALALLRADLSHFKAQSPITLSTRPWAPWAWANGPVLVDALLDDGDLDAAWPAAEGAATQAQWLRLADASINARPADALAVYTEAIKPLRTMTGDQTYQQMARLLLSVRACHETLGSMAEFRNYLAYVRMDQKRKRNLMRILDENGL